MLLHPEPKLLENLKTQGNSKSFKQALLDPNIKEIISDGEEEGMEEVGPPATIEFKV